MRAVRRFAAMFAALAVSTSAPPALASEAAIRLWRLDCGRFVVNFPSGSGDGTTTQRTLTSSCYLIAHGSEYLLWDTGLSDSLIGNPSVTPQQTITLERTILSQLQQIGVAAHQVTRVGISHYHGDHIGQASHFRHARLFMGRADIAALRAAPANDRRVELLAPWLSGDAALVETEGDYDIFGDGRIVMIATRGHTPGHNALLVRLASGAVLLSGDLYHFRDQIESGEISANDSNPEDTPASRQRFQAFAGRLNARVIVQHAPEDIAALPAFPDAAR